MPKNIHIKFDPKKAAAVRITKIGMAQAALDTQVIKDSNYYCPFDEGTLQSSALTASNIGQGEILWATPYARRQYYDLPNKSKDKNPEARMKWFEEAKARKRNDWLALVARGSGGHA